MRVAVMTAPGEVRVEDRPEPVIVEPTDAIIRLAATCICGSDLWPYRGIEALDGPKPMGHEYAGIVEEVGSAVTTVRPGQFVVGSFFASDNTCEICRSGYQSHCVRRESAAPDGAQAERMRVTLADGAHSVIEAVGTQESMMQAIRSTRPGGHVGYVGVAHDVQLPGEELFFSHVHLHGGPAPVRRFLPELMNLILNRRIDPGKVFDLELRWTRPPTATGPWTPRRRSRSSSVPDTALITEQEPSQCRHWTKAAVWPARSRS
jgi:threonine dehydrogenase-like Zn-dependent dehydrogenase